jgi:dipeptidyl aminopeptidase/acylaminoacyl peptidase
MEASMTKIVLDKLLRLPGVYQPFVSPDRKWVAWTWYHRDDRANVYLAPTDGSSKPLRLTDSEDDVHIVSWSSASESLMVESCRDGNERMRLYRLDIVSRALTLLTDAEPNYYLRGGDLHRNGRWLVYGANYDFAAESELDVTCVYRHNLKTGERKLLAKPLRSPERSRNAPILNAQGSHVLYFRAERGRAGQQVWLVDINGRNDREIIHCGDGKVTASWMPDGKRVLFLSEVDGHYRRLGIFDRTRNTTKWLVNDPQRNIEHAWPIAGTPFVAVLEVKNAHEHCFLLDVARRNEIHLVSAQEDGTLIPLAPASDDQWVGMYYDSRRPVDVVRFALPRVGCLVGWQAVPKGVCRVHGRSLTKFRGIARKHLAVAEDFFWQATDGLDLHGFVYRAMQPRGTIVLVHGGPRDHSEARFDAKVQYLVSEGFNVFQPNYRGSTGYGLKFQESIKADGWGAMEQEDIRAGIQALMAAGIARPGKVAITGTSYGGYSAWHAVTRFPVKLVAAAAPICGMTDLIVDYNTTRPDLRGLSEEMMGGSPMEVPDKYRERSPINYVSQIKGKLLIVQGQQDPNVTPENVRFVRKALDSAGITYEVLEFQDEGHGIYKRENVKFLLERLAEFFRAAMS